MDNVSLLSNILWNSMIIFVTLLNSHNFINALYIKIYPIGYNNYAVLVSVLFGWTVEISRS